LAPDLLLPACRQARKEGEKVLDRPRFTQKGKHLKNLEKEKQHYRLFLNY